MENTDKAWDKVFRLVHLVKHTKYNTADGVKQTIQKRTVLKKKETELFVNGKNTVAVSRNNLLGKWYISFNYPFWKIKEYDTSAEVEKAVRSGEADCFVVKAGQSLKTLANSKMRSIFLTKSGTSCFAVTRENTTLMNILNKTIQTLPDSRLSSQFCVYENAPGKVTLAEYIKDNLRVVSIGFVSVALIIILIIGYLMIKARKAQIQAEKANAAKSDFLFNMSHDIRTPMNALLGYSELIKRELTDPKLLDYQEKMEQSGNLLLSIINNVLDMARIESGKVELDEDYVQIRDIYHGVYKIFLFLTTEVRMLRGHKDRKFLCTSFRVE